METTLPATSLGTSIVALSDSKTTKACSFAITSPGLTKISITGMSVKSPILGTLIAKIVIPAPYKTTRRKSVSNSAIYALNRVA